MMRTVSLIFALVVFLSYQTLGYAFDSTRLQPLSPVTPQQQNVFYLVGQFQALVPFSINALTGGPPVNVTFPVGCPASLTPFINCFSVGQDSSYPSHPWQSCPLLNASVGITPSAAYPISYSATQITAPFKSFTTYNFNYTYTASSSSGSNYKGSCLIGGYNGTNSFTYQGQKMYFQGAGGPAPNNTLICLIYCYFCPPGASSCPNVPGQV